jgi:hypothetical protein
MNLRPTLLLFAVALSGAAQSLSVGIQGGVPFGDTFRDGAAGSRYSSFRYASRPVPYTVGAVLEWKLSDRLAAAAAVCYQRVHYDFSGSEFVFSRLTTSVSSGSARGNAWTIPLTLRYSPRGLPGAFAGAGPVVRHFSQLRQSVDETSHFLGAPGQPPSDTRRHLEIDNPRDFAKRWYPGVAAEAGYRWRLGRVAIVPQFRYIRWLANTGADGMPLRFPANQATVLVGILR